MRSPTGRFTIVFNGENYDYRELHHELGSPVLRGPSDTEVLLADLEAWGLHRTLERTDGMFALGLWDRAQPEMTLARDRLGEKPLYYGTAAGGWCSPRSYRPSS